MSKTTITFERTAFQPALAMVQSAIEKRNTIPILGNIRLAAQAGTVDLTGTDLDIEIRATCAAQTEIGKCAEITLPAATLYDITRKLPDGCQIKLEWDDAGGQATLRAGRSRFMLNTLPATDFPDIASGEMSHSFTMPAKALARLIDKTKFAVSTEETRYYLCGIYLHVDEAALVAVTTDGHRLAKATTALPEGAEGMPGIIIPRKTVDQIAKLLKECGGDIGIAISAAKIQVEAGGFHLTSKLIDGTFPDYKRVIPVRNELVARFDRAELAKAADLVATISSERGWAVKFSLAENALTLSVQNPDAEQAEECLTVDYAGRPIEIGFNAKYLAEILGTLAGTSVQADLDSPGSPTLLRDPEDESALYVLMPMRV